MRRLIVLALASLVFLIAAPAALAQGAGDVILQGERVIRSGETHEGDLMVMGGKLTVQQGGSVQGDVALFGGELDLAGTIRGDVAAFGGWVRVRSMGVLDGSLMSIGARVDRETGAQIRGDTFPPGLRTFGPPAPTAPGAPRFNGGNPVLEFLGWVLRMILTTVGVTVLAVVAMLLLPRQMRVVADTIRDNATASVGVGALTWVVAVIALPLIGFVSLLLLIVCIGVLGFVLDFAIFLLLSVAIVFGWLATGLVLGEALVRAARVRDDVPLVAAGVGAVILTGAASIVNAIPCIGGLLWWLFTLPGLGAVVLTWFGMRPWQLGQSFLPDRTRGPQGSTSVGGWTAPTTSPTGGPGAAQPAAPGEPSGERPSPWAPRASDDRPIVTPAPETEVSPWAPRPWSRVDVEEERGTPAGDLPHADYETPQAAAPMGTADLEARPEAAEDVVEGEVAAESDLPQPDYEDLKAPPRGTSDLETALGREGGIGPETVEERPDLPQPDYGGDQPAPSTGTSDLEAIVGPSATPDEDEGDVRQRPGRGGAEDVPSAQAYTPQRDDMQALPDVGPVYERLLNERGVTTYAQLANMTSAEVMDILNQPDVVPVTYEEAERLIAAARGRL